ncbi:MAG: peptidoglycan DD-metalloendopeptidase family protein, partial [Raoultibacter sp.]
VRLGNRAASMYKGGTISFIDVLLGASSFDEFLNTWDMVAKISSSDAALVQESKDLRQTALDAQAAFEAEQKKAALALEESKNTKEQMESTRAGMLTEIANINVEVAELQEEEALQAEAALRAKEDEERRQQSNNSNQSSITGTGQLGHPLPGATMTSGFGYRDFDQSFHQGIDFAAGTGTPYYAAESGTVSEAYPSGGGSGGIWLKIVHGNGLVTRYLHSSEIYVSVGDQVTKGQVIGAVGNTGNSSGAHLHFGVELNGSFVNPLSYL